MRSLKATSGRSRLAGQGPVEDFSQPKVEADYDVSLDLAEAAAIARRPEIQRGAIQLTGHGSWSGQDFSTIGKAILSNLDWRDAPIGVHNAGLSAQYNVDPKRLSLSQIEGRVLGGSVVGDAEVTNWLNPQPPSKNARGKKTGCADWNRAPSLQGLIRRGNCGCGVHTVASVSTNQTCGTCQRKRGGQLEGHDPQYGSPVRGRCSASGQLCACAISADCARPGSIPARTRRIGTGGADGLDARYPDSRFRHAFFQCGAQALGYDD